MTAKDRPSRGEIHRAAVYELARRDFWSFCHLLAPDFYTADRGYLKDLCGAFQDFVKSDSHDVLIINTPPRHGKSRTASLFVEWLLGRDHGAKIMTGSYNTDLSTQFSKAVRNGIQEEKADPAIPVVHDVFPDLAIKEGDGRMDLWSLVDGFQNYLATSPNGTATGFGASIIIVDDLIKNAEEANNARTLDSQWRWFSDTMLSRLESGGKIILIMTRWSTQDLSGRAMDELPGAVYRVKVITYKALQDDGTMLCDGILSREEYDRRQKVTDPAIFAANYQQRPIDVEGCLYGEFKTYQPGEEPDFIQRRAYVDTADTGSDYLAAYVYGETGDGQAYILDVLYTQDPMEATEPATAELLDRNRVNVCRVESNNGGRGFARAVERLSKERGNRLTVIEPFTQTKNKQSRIYTYSTWCENNIFFPAGWEARWPELFDSLAHYQRAGKNAHDDAEDALTGIAEDIAERPRMRW